MAAVSEEGKDNCRRHLRVELRRAIISGKLMDPEEDPL
jgi:hypothetical protein